MNVLLWENVLASIANTSPEQLLQKIVGNLNPLNAFSTGLAAAARPAETILDLLACTLLGKTLQQVKHQVGQTVPPGGMNVAATIQELCLYLQTDDKFVRPIRQELIDGLCKAQQYDEIVLVSHSLGTVVAFDVLNQWTESKPKISHWFTLGCPLTKVLRLRPGTPNRLMNANVEQWYNIYDTTDIIASPLGPTFTKPGYNIHDIFVDVAIGLAESHKYLKNPTTLRLIADAVQSATPPGNP